MSRGNGRLSTGSAAVTLSQALGFSEAIVEVAQPHPGLRRILSGSGGTLGFLVTLDDERIVDLEVEIGLGHRGFEKEVENVAWPNALPYVRRLGYAGGLIAEVGYCLAVETLSGWNLPDRARWLRTLACELARITDHFARLAAVSAAIDLPAAEQTAQAGEVEAMRLLGVLTGAGPLEPWSQFGGVARGWPEGFAVTAAASRARLSQILDRFARLSVDNPSCQRRLRGVATLSAQEGVGLAVSGPVLRAAGEAMDVRRDRPYLAYDAVDFDVPIGENGDDLDRLLVVVEEIRQSLRIAEQCETLLDSLGPGEIAVPASQVEGLAFEDDDPARLRLPAGEVACSVESSTGELGFLLVSDGRAQPRRIHCRAPSLLHAQAMPAMLRGDRLEDLLPTAALLHLVSGECDR